MQSLKETFEGLRGRKIYSVYTHRDLGDKAQIVEAEIAKIYLNNPNGPQVEIKFEPKMPTWSQGAKTQHAKRWISEIFETRQDCLVSLLERERRRHLDNMANILDQGEEPKPKAEESAHE